MPSDTMQYEFSSRSPTALYEEKWGGLTDGLKDAGIPDVKIDTSSVGKNFCSGSYMGKAIKVSWVEGEFMVLSMEGYSQGLVDGISKVLGHRPFCRYVHTGPLYGMGGLAAVEWDMVDPEARYAKLERSRLRVEKLEPIGKKD